MEDRNGDRAELADLAEPSDNAAAIDAAIELLKAVPLGELQARGIHFEPLHFYSSANNLEYLAKNRDLWHGRSLPRGVPWDLDRQIERLTTLARHFHELAEVPTTNPTTESASFYWDNPFWRDADAFVQYGMVRECKPKRVVEIGCGWSSLLLAVALERNLAEGGGADSVHQIEPFFQPHMRDALPAEWTQHERELQRVPLALFEDLAEGDICFYDGSHVARTASDVVWFFSEVLPRLAPGVIVHIHDIFWPDDYPDEWVFDRAHSWNEQYMLHAFLAFNDAFEMLICNSALFTIKQEAVVDLYDGTVANGHGCSIWLRRRDPLEQAHRRAAGLRAGV